MSGGVSLFLPSLGGGGAEKCMLNLAKGIAKRGVNIELVLGSAEGHYLPLVQGRLAMNDLHARHTRWQIPRLSQYLRKRQPDVLLSALDRANLVALVSKQLSGIGLHTIVSTHTVVSQAASLSPRIGPKLLPVMMRFLYPSADSIVAVSKSVAADLAAIIGQPEKRIHVIHNPVPLDEIASLASESVAHPWFASTGIPVIVSVGNLWPDKDFETLIRAIHAAKRTRPLRLAILGEGPSRPPLTRLVQHLGLEDSVWMPGFVPNPYAFLARAAVFVLPSKREGLPTALVEAMALGITPVATDCVGGSAEVLDGGRYGLLTPVGNPIALSDAILESIERPLDRALLLKRAGDFSVERAVDGYLSLVGTVLTGGS